ncbi:TonB-dependent receptor, partial [Caulobacter sp. 17J65-9]|nr:TonB-dependent receptor [Caulobacter sp. 17J65-9]
RAGAYEEAKGAGLVGANSRASGVVASLAVAAPPDEERLGWRVQAWARDTDLVNRSVAVGAARAFTTPANDQYATPALGWGVNAAVGGVDGGLTWEAGLDARFADGESRERFRFIGGNFTRDRRAGGRQSVAGAYVDGAWRSGSWLVAGGARLDGWASGDGRRVERDRATGAVLLDDRPPDRDGT